jgi:hypothetical protein
MARTFEARFPGTCVECWGTVKIGHEATYNSSNGLIHVSCPDILVEPWKTPVCPHCFQHKATNGSCACE